MLRKTLCKIDVIFRGTLLFLIKLYQLALSPWKNTHCRFFPSCSNYAKQALERYSFLTGLYFILRRLLRCHPFHSGGYDPLPKSRRKKKK